MLLCQKMQTKIYVQGNKKNQSVTDRIWASWTMILGDGFSMLFCKIYKEFKDLSKMPSAQISKLSIYFWNGYNENNREWMTTRSKITDTFQNWWVLGIH